ncbi:hypothetical protein GALMADRAFT_239698 [Galerina marginata CBS 339.88]|uniref:Phorbol-ester/DAG-type domain-containing protein n=1 Tax=Galerina marginata (strain CBS 339.88) TaxID=685588 RepID=A0A067TNY5_GALM3|nr:hypothetical protein GALMADRAFT_239698 [Galerina marginata CBS 339.88]
MTDGRANRNNLSLLDTSFTFNVYDETWDPGASAAQLSPTVRTAVIPTNVAPPAEPHINSRARNESRKLLSHVLIQLANRRKPESIVETIASITHESSEGSFGALAETLKEAIKRGGRHEARVERRPTIARDDSDDEREHLFTTDDTIDLLVQLMDVLTMSVAQRWQIFEDSPNLQDPERRPGRDSKLSSAFRRSRSGGKRSRSSSPYKGQVQVPELLSLCVSVLRSIVSEDCRYRVASPRPSRPPNSLQILTLNIAQFLVHSHRHSPRVISQIAFAMIPALHTFNSSMNPRLLFFFESSVVRIVLENLEDIQGPSKNSVPRVTNPDVVINSSTGYHQNPVVSIQIDEVQAESPPSHLGRKWLSPSNPAMGDQVQSTNNPRQSPNIYYLAFLIPPLLGAMLDSFNNASVSNIDEGMSARFIKLLELIASSKLDAYNDILEVIAYRGPTPRRLAIASLARLWPKSIGHSVISHSLCSFNLDEAKSLHTARDPYAHQFMPWHFERAHNFVHLGNILHGDCRSCSKSITGFGLLCPFCMTAVHFDCYEYPRGNYEIHYAMDDDSPVQRIAMCRFSRLQINGDPVPGIIVKHSHRFEPANWFTLCLCFVCQKPLWGTFAQGLKCGECSISLHRTCVPSFYSVERCGVQRITSRDMTINWNSLRSSCLDHFPVLHFTRDQLKRCTYEEVAIFHSVLRIQLQILLNGVEFGSIVVVQRGKKAANSMDQTLDSFELHEVTRTCEQLLGSGRLALSPLTQQYMQETEMSRPEIMHNWSYLEYVTAAIKTSSPQSRKPPRSASDLLNVDHSVDVDDEESDSTTYPFESTTLSHMRNILAVDFTLHSDHAAQFILNQLHHLSFFERVDRGFLPFEDIFHEKDVKCIFPLPLGLDLSMNVETLVSAVEASLADLDLSSNEFGFLLLTRRFWPNGLASEYGLKRLAGRILSWILDEDDSLGVMLREFVAKQQPPPGVRTDRHSPPWPLLPDFRPGSAGPASNGGDYVAARRSLLFRFALPWLLELHNLHPDFYCQTVFDTCFQAAVNRDPKEFDMSHYVNLERNHSNLCDDVLRSIVKLCQFSVVFTVFDQLFVRWMDLLFDLNQVDKAMPSLPRLWGNDNDTTQRTSFLVDPTFGLSDAPSPLYVDPLRAVSNLAAQSREGLSRSLSYLSGVVKSGVDIPTTSFKQFLTLITSKSNKDSLLENANMFTRATFLSLWLRSSGRQNLQALISILHSHLAPKILESLITGKEVAISFSIIRQSLAACLLLYGCERSSITAAGIVSSRDIHELPSRRKLTIRGGGVVDPVIIEPEILNALKLYLQSNVDDVSCLIAKFVNMFITESPFLEGFEIDNFILRNGKLISFCAWTVYNIQQENIATVRTALLLRSLLVDSEHFQDILSTNMDPLTSSTEQRLSSVNRLFRMISDVTSPAFHVEGRQWRPSVIEIFYYFFSALWADPNEEIRIAVRSFSAALLPGHFEAIALCWNEALTKAPILERTRLVGFLIQLRPHFLGWKVLAWENIIDTLVEYDYDPKGIHEAFVGVNNTFTESRKDTYRLSSADPDLSHLRVSMILLSLQMIADGVEIDNFSVMKLKVQFVQIAGFGQISVFPSQSGQSFNLQFGDISEISDSAYPCIEELAHVVDAPHYLKLSYAALGIPDGPENKTVSVLIGSVFLDASLSILGTLRSVASLPVLTLKCVLETLYIIIHKYDFEDHLFQHLQPLLRRSVLRVMELLSTDISYELRQLSLSIAQASIKKWHSFLGATVSTILELVATEIASQTGTSQDSLVVHGKLLIGSTLQSFHNKGLLLDLMRRPLQPDFFIVLNQVFNGKGKDTTLLLQATCDQLLRDTLFRAVDCDPASFQTVLQNISSFIDVVYHQGYSLELIVFTGQHLTHLVRRMSDGTIQGADPSPLIMISVVLMQNNKKLVKELLPYVDTVLRVALNRLQVDLSSLNRLIKVASTYRPRVQDTAPGTVDIISVLFEILVDAIRMKTKMLPLTIKSLIESLIENENSDSIPPSTTHGQLFRNMMDDAYNFLQNYAWHEENIEHDFQAVMATARLLLQATNSQDPTMFSRLTEEKSSKSPLNIRSWNVLLLTALQGGNDDWRSMIFSSFPTFGNTYSALLRSYVHSGIPSSTNATTDINQAHIAMKLWFMLANTVSKQNQSGETTVSGVWNELWPPYEGFLNVLETEAQAGLHSTLVSLTSTSVADLLIYIHSLKTPLSFDTSAHVAILNRLRLLNRGESTSTKIARAMRLMTEPTPDIVSGSVLMDQIAKELVAAEKIQIVESRRDNSKIPGDRYRKDGRLPTT